MAQPSDFNASIDQIMEALAPIQAQNVLSGRYTHYAEGEMPVTLPEGLAARCDEYLGPQGVGYQVIFTCTDPDGGEWRKSINVGPETYRNQDWAQIAEG